jgi:hypothetical protein
MALSMSTQRMKWSSQPQLQSSQRYRSASKAAAADLRLSFQHPDGGCSQQPAAATCRPSFAHAHTYCPRFSAAAHTPTGFLSSGCNPQNSPPPVRCPSITPTS